MPTFGKKCLTLEKNMATLARECLTFLQGTPTKKKSTPTFRKKCLTLEKSTATLVRECLTFLQGTATKKKSTLSFATRPSANCTLSTQST